MINLTTLSEKDFAFIKEKIGRKPRGVAGVALRCICNNPIVISTKPRLNDNSPFPTTFYLVNSYIISYISRLEAIGLMKFLFLNLKNDISLARKYKKAHNHYINFRNLLGKKFNINNVEEIDSISAGGMPNRIKCLHALTAHSLASGSGVNPIGDYVLSLIKYDFIKNSCLCDKVL